MNPILINPKIDSSASTTEQLGQMKSYLRQFKEQIELILMNIDTDNMSEKFQDEVYEGMSKRIMGDKSISEIAQTAGMIKMSVKDLEGSMSSLTLTVNGIQSEVYDGQGNSRITQTANAISSEITRATNAESSLSSRITQTDSDITAEITRAESAERTLSSRISANASAISLKVSEGEILDGLAQEMSSEISITSNYIKLISGGQTLFEVNSNGTVSIEGDVSMDSGYIGYFNLNDRGAILGDTTESLFYSRWANIGSLTLSTSQDGSNINGSITGMTADFAKLACDMGTARVISWKRAASAVSDNNYVLVGAG